MTNISLEPFGKGDHCILYHVKIFVTILRAAYYFTTSNGYFNFIGQQFQYAVNGNDLSLQNAEVQPRCYETPIYQSSFIFH
jgi:hypothetical protein